MTKFNLTKDVEEVKQATGKNTEEKTTVKKEAPKELKDKVMSLKIRPSDFENFSKINKVRGISNSSAINMMITDYIRQHSNLL